MTEECGLTTYYLSSYNYMSRSHSRAQAFELWLWEQGGQVKQENRRRFIEFTDDGQGMLFALRYG